MRDVHAIILGGGRGNRLYPLTKHRAKPAVPLAGKFRLIDIPISNCINSNIQKMFVLTQYNSASLNRHINLTYHFSTFSEAFVEVLAAQQTNENSFWFQGTADAVRQHLPTLRSRKVSEYLILSGDHLYRMDYRAFIEYHREKNADLTIAVMPVAEQQASSLGLIQFDAEGRVTMFREKPEGEALLEMKVDTTILGLDEKEAQKKPYIASMGIYVFKPEVMVDGLQSNPRFTDFGKEIIPGMVKTHNIQAYLFDDYWEDIGTIASFFEANMELLTQPKPKFSFYDDRAPIYTRPRFLPSNKIAKSTMENCMLADGCIIYDSKISHSILGIRTRIEAKTIIENTLIMGADFYQSDADRKEDAKKGIPHIGIGEGTRIKKAIIDKNARIGKNVRILNKDGIEEYTEEEERYAINNGIVIVNKGAIIPDNFVI